MDEPEKPPGPESALEPEEPETPWWQLLLIYTRDWIHYGALAFFLILVLAAAVRGVLAR